MTNLGELEKLAKSSMSQSWVSLEISDVLKLIAVAKAAKEFRKEGQWEQPVNAKTSYYQSEFELDDALAALESSDD
jgi:hypothetical protein